MKGGRFIIIKLLELNAMEMLMLNIVTRAKSSMTLNQRRG